MTLFVPRFATEFAPMFRLIEDFSQVARRSPACGPRYARRVQSFQPRFDVTESKDSYELKGELPGVDQKDIQVEFTSENTLRVQGRRERHHEEGTRPETQVEAAPEQTQATEGDTTSETGSYHKASVEDEYVSVTNAGDAEATPAETPKEETVAAKQEVAQAPKSEGSRYWLSERSVGQFSRTFSFPKRIDQDNVTASLKDGILSVVVAKAAIPENKRINIE